MILGLYEFIGLFDSQYTPLIFLFVVIILDKVVC